MRKIFLALPLLSACSLIVGGVGPERCDEGSFQVRCDDGGTVLVTCEQGFEKRELCSGASVCDATNAVCNACGDGFLSPAEECDNGTSNSDTNPDACRTTCVAASCGDGLEDTGEECDDSNNENGDGCSDACVDEICGDGVVNNNDTEECDDGANNSDTAPDACREDCVAAFCGDNVQDTGEECDDGNNIDADGCQGNCLLNNPPTATEDAASTNEDTPLILQSNALLANDTDIDADFLTLTGVQGAIDGSVALSAGEITFTPDANFNGTASFEYIVEDGQGGEDIGFVSVTVDAINDLPVATDDLASTDEDQALDIAAATLLANDIDVDGDTLTVTEVTNAVNGSVTLDGGQITFTPDLNFNGSASFTYTMEDGQGGSDTGLATITVGSINDPPVAVDDSAATDEDINLVLNTATLLANDVEIDGGALTITAVSSLQGGTAALNGAQITFTPDPNFNGTASFEYTVSDGQGGSDAGLVTITVDAVNDAPVAVDDNAATDEDTQLVLNTTTLLANDTDVDNDALSITAVTNPQGGSATLNGGQITFTPDADFDGTASFSYNVSDGNGGNDTGLVTISINAINDPPQATDDIFFTQENTPLVLDTAQVLANDLDVDGDNLTVTEVSGAINGSVALVGGQITFTPDANFNGSASFVYTISDGALTDTATVNINVNDVNNPPTATDDTFSTDEDTQLVLQTIDVLNNDLDPDGDGLFVDSVQNAQEGTVALNGGLITFTPNANFNGTASFEYTASDGQFTDTGLVTITVNAVNDAPIALADTASTNEDTLAPILTAVLLGNDDDVDGDSLTVTSVQNAQNGSAVLSGGQINFTPNANFFGTASFEYTVSDGNGGSDTAQVIVTVNAVNDAPVAVDDTASVNEDQVLSLNAATLLANDIDVDGDTLSLIAVSGAVNGNVTLNGAQVVFTPNTNFNGTTSFVYTVSDGALTDTGRVTVTVNPVNDAPVAADDSVTTDENVDLFLSTASLLANDTDIDTGDTLSITAVANAQGGTVALNGAQVVFAPNPDFNGAASFEYTVSDGNGGSDTARVTVTVNAVNDAPIAVGDNFETDEDIVLALDASDLLVNDIDVDGDFLSVSSVQPISGGIVELNGDQIFFTPDPDFNGNAFFNYTMTDGQEFSTAEVNVFINPVNDAPIAEDQFVSTLEDTSVAITLTAFDVDGDTLSFAVAADPVNGVLSGNAPDLVYTPDPDFNGTDSFFFEASDGQAISNLGLIEIEVIPAADCGDGITEGGEQCDDGGESDFCDADCSLADCGDGQVNTTSGEQCDSGGESNFCDADCSIAACGDGQFNAAAGEECDDGNDIEGDGCDSNCTTSRCGNGIVQSEGPLGFDAQVAFNAGSGPQDVATADFDGDGDLDLVTANGISQGGSVNVLTNNGTSFEVTAVADEIGPGVDDVATADFNQDGNVDFVVSISSNSVRVFESSPPTFLFSDFSTTSGSIGSPQDIAIGDFNDDGRPDIVTGNLGSDDVSVLRNDGVSGGGISFAAPAIFGIGGAQDPFALAAGQLDGTLGDDIVTANFNTDDISVRFSNSAGGFSTVIRVPAGNGPIAVAIADFEGDGSNEIAVASQLSNDVRIFRVDPAGGSFPILAQFPLPPVQNTILNDLELAAADLDGDGLPELIASSPITDKLAVFQLQGGAPVLVAELQAGNFGNPNFANPTGIAAGDFDLDGRVDLVNSNGAGASVSVYLSNRIVGEACDDGNNIDGDGCESDCTLSCGNGVFDAGEGCDDGNNVDGDGCSAACVFEFCGDGIVNGNSPLGFDQCDDGNQNNRDACTNNCTNNFCGDGTFVVGETCYGLPQNTVTLGTTFGIAFDRLDGDTNEDMVVTNNDNATISVLRGDGLGDFIPINDFPTGGGAPRGLQIVDVDSDGILDIVTANLLGDTVSRLFGDGLGGVNPPIVTSVGDRPNDLVVGNFDGDPILDVVTPNENSDDVTVLFDFGGGAFLPLGVGAAPLAVASADFNRDGLLDFAVANSGPAFDSVRVFFNQGNGSFNSTVFPVGASPVDMVVGDFDFNGFVDIATANKFSNDVSVLFNQDGSLFQERLNDQGNPIRLGSGGDGPVALAPGDLDQDGDLDLAVINNFSGNVTMLLNSGNDSFAPAQILDPFVENPLALAVKDINGDGIPDLAYSNNDTSDGFFFIKHLISSP